MKHIVIDLNDPNEPVIFSNSILGNFYFETFFREFEAETSECMDSNEQSELLHTTQIVEPHCTIMEDCTKLGTKKCTDIVYSSCDFY